MTKQDFGTEYGTLASKNVLIKLAQGYRPLSNGLIRFGAGSHGYKNIVAIAAAAPLDLVAQAAVTMMGQMEDISNRVRDVSLGCFGTQGQFTPAITN